MKTSGRGKRAYSSRARVTCRATTSRPRCPQQGWPTRWWQQIGNGFSFCVVNFANPDMVGHTGVIPAVVQAVETADLCLGRVVQRVSELGGVCLITADHGNAEKMLEDDGTSPHTAHTTNPVPLIVTAPGSQPEERRRDRRPDPHGPGVPRPGAASRDDGPLARKSYVRAKKTAAKPDILWPLVATPA